MDPQVQASFIPKRSLDTTSHRGGVGLLFLISLLIFIASLVAAGGEFAYQQYLNKALASKKASLDLAQGAFDPATIEDLARLNQRITQAKTLLQEHVAPSGVFAFLSTQTLQNVVFKSFSFTLNSDGSAKISMTGTADSFSTVALQSDQFGGSKVLKDVVFSDITVDSSGAVDFSVSATVDASVVSYANTLQAASVSQASTTAQ